MTAGANPHTVTPPTDRPLAGRRILVTRPAGQAEGLIRRIVDAGGEAIAFPALEIVAVEPPPAPPTGLDAALFVSPNAARYGVPLFGDALPARLYAVGPGTARALADAGVAGVETPDGQDSEALLALPSLADVAGQRLLIVRGVGGRELIADTLRARGAEVAYLECYRRARPTTDAAPLIARWNSEGIDAVTVASFETLENLAALLGAPMRERLLDTPLFAPHAKIADAARRFGARRAIATAGGDAGLAEGLANWFRNPL